MVAQPQPPRRGDGRLSHRLRAWLMSSGSSGALVEPRPPEPPHTAPPLPPPLLPPSPPSLPYGDDDDDLAPTLPRIPSIPRLPALSLAVPPVPPAAARMRVAADFAAFMLARNYIHGARLDGLTADQRMRLFVHVGQVYLPALAIAGRMPAPEDAARDELAGEGTMIV